MSPIRCSTDMDAAQQHEADFVTLPAELLATQSVTEFVQNFDKRHCHGQNQPTIGCKELLKRWQLGVDCVVLTGQQQR